VKRVLLLLITSGFFFLGPAVDARAANVATVTFSENLASGNSLVAYEVASSSTALTAVNQLKPAFVNPGFGFVSWNTKPNGSGTTYLNGAKYSFKSDIVLYAQWASLFSTVQFLENRSPADLVFSTESKNIATALTLFGSLTPQFSNPGFTFAGWNTKANGKGTALSDGQTYGFTSDLVLYAQWRKAPPMQPALVMVGALGPTSHATLTSIAGALTAQHAHVVEVVQCGAKAPAGSAIATSLTRLLLGHHNGSVNVTFRGFTQSAGPNLTEVFASELVPN